ncbi:GNAT family N-acetyltransferase [Actinopolymorpha singaporensis]|uniref:GNAT family N-acetyltransferase n=1 Tax=Actinopolymorpha singaporensis TaxID=117157 RepID=UPI0012FE7C25|nr:GNAT family N-acetyltransferase [Actinopolymorpha singaporensis]
MTDIRCGGANPQLAAVLADRINSFNVAETGIGWLLQAITEEARTRSCTQIVLHTHTFQAPDFYLRHGFEEAGRADGYPAGHAFLLMRKDIAR